MQSRADSMSLLARVEEARETRYRAELRSTEQALADAAAGAADAVRIYMETCEQRRTLLRQRYQAIQGVRSVTDVQSLRSTEQTLDARREKAMQIRQAAETVEQEALAASERARQILREVSLRRLRRSRVADLLTQTEKRAALLAEEENVSEESMDRFRGTAVE